MEQSKGIALLFLLGIGAYLYSTQSDASIPSDSAPASPSFDPFNWFDASPPAPVDSGEADYTPEDFMDDPTSGSGAYWKTNSYPNYASLITLTEQKNGIPTDLLARQLYQESRFLDQYIFGPPNSSGAQGIAQFLEATGLQYGLANRSDPADSIRAAGEYMRDLYRMTGNWKDALMAYDWGIGFVRTWVKQGRPITTHTNSKGQTIPYPPTEAINYFTQITADVPVA